MRVKEIKQLTQSECGTCCVLMILRFYKSHESMKEVQDELDAGRDGTSVKQITNFLTKKNMNVKLFEIDSLISLKQIKFPCILYWNNNHYVILEKIKKNKYEIVDPAEGRKSMSEAEFLNCFSNIVIQAEPKTEFVATKRNKKSPWFKIIESLLIKKKLLFLVLLSLITTYLITLSVPILVRRIINSITEFTMETNRFYYLLTALIFTFLVTSVYKGFKTTQLNVFLSEILEKNTFKKLINLPYKFFETRPTGDILYRISSTSAVKELIASQLMLGVIDIGALLVIFLYMITSSLRLSLISLFLLSLNYLILLWFQPRLRKAIDNEILVKSKAQSVQVETIYSIDLVKITGLEESFLEKWIKLFEESLSHFSHRSNLSNINNVFITCIQIFSPVLIFLVGVQEVANNQLDIGDLVAFQTISSMFFSNGNAIFSSYTQLILANQYLIRIEDIWDAEEEERKINGLNIKLTGLIEIKNLDFSYSKNSSQTLKDISLKIFPGQKIAFVGVSGSGKSSLSKLITGLYKPIKGKVLFDGHCIEEYSKDVLQKQIASVPQNAMLFNKTIKENILLSNKINSEELIEICKIACIYDEIMGMPMNFQTVVSEFGMNLSGGQRQRVLLARALVQKPQIIILDESTSSLDSINETKIMDYLSRSGCTIIHIAHRLSTIKDSDKIYVFDNGKIKESGTHEELINNSSIYTDLYKASILVN